jgi:hypothetical protein
VWLNGEGTGDRPFSPHRGGRAANLISTTKKEICLIAFEILRNAYRHARAPHRSRCFDDGHFVLGEFADRTAEAMLEPFSR